MTEEQEFETNDGPLEVASGAGKTHFTVGYGGTYFCLDNVNAMDLAHMIIRNLWTP